MAAKDISQEQRNRPLPLQKESKMSTVEDVKQDVAAIAEKALSPPRMKLARWEWVVRFFPVHNLSRPPDGSRLTLDTGIQKVLNDWELEEIEFVQLVPTPVGDYIFVGRKRLFDFTPRPEDSGQTSGPAEFTAALKGSQDLAKEAEPQSITPPTHHQSSPCPPTPKEAAPRTDGGKTSGKSPRRR